MAWILKNDTEQPQEQPKPLGDNEVNVGWLARNATRLGSRALETTLGIPGEILATLEAGNQFVNSLLPKFLQQEEKGVPFPFNYVPTSEEVKQGVKATVGKVLPENYLEPQSQGEEYADFFTKEFLPTYWWSKGPKVGRALKSGASVLARDFSKHFLEEAGAPKYLSEPISIAAGTLPFLVGGRKNLSKMSNEAYTAAENSLPNGARSFQKGLNKKFTQLEAQVAKSNARDANKVKEALEKITAHNLSGNSIKVVDAIGRKRDFNQMWPSLSTEMKRVVEPAIEELNKAIHHYGKDNAAFLKNWMMAEDVYKGLASSSSISKVLSSMTGSKKFNNPVTKFLIDQAPLLSAGHDILSGGLPLKTAGGFAAKEGLKLYTLLNKSKVARHFYKQFMKNALAGNVAASQIAMQRFNNAANDYDKKNRYRLVRGQG